MDNKYRGYSSSYRNGITSYSRDGGSHTRGMPRRRSNMIYARKRRRWPYLLAAVIVVVAVVGIRFFACSSDGNETQQAEESGQQAEQVQEQQGQGEGPQDAQDGDGADSASAQQTAAGAEADDPRAATSDSRNDAKPDHKVCYLTFDDGPSANTHEIMEILERHNAKATWFVIGKCTHPEYMKDLWDAGHQIALHTYSHEYDQVYASTKAFWKEIDQIAEKAQGYIGFKPTLFRFPGGSVNDYNTAISKSLRTQAYEKGYHYFDWNISSGDASGNGVAASKIVSNIKRESKGCNSCCVLMHDTEAKGTTVDALEKICSYYEKQGFTFEVLTADSFGYHFQQDN